MDDREWVARQGVTHAPHAKSMDIESLSWLSKVDIPMRVCNNVATSNMVGGPGEV